MAQVLSTHPWRDVVRKRRKYAEVGVSPLLDHPPRVARSGRLPAKCIWGLEEAARFRAGDPIQLDIGPTSISFLLTDLVQKPSGPGARRPLPMAASAVRATC